MKVRLLRLRWVIDSSPEGPIDDKAVSFRQSCVGLSSGVNRRRQMGPGLFLWEI